MTAGQVAYVESPAIIYLASKPLWERRECKL